MYIWFVECFFVFVFAMPYRVLIGKLLLLNMEFIEFMLSGETARYKRENPLFRIKLVTIYTDIHKIMIINRSENKKNATEMWKEKKRVIDTLGQRKKNGRNKIIIIIIVYEMNMWREGARKRESKTSPLSLFAYNKIKNV